MSKEKFAIFPEKIFDNFMYEMSLLHTSLSLFFLVHSLIGIQIRNKHNTFALVFPSPS